MKKTSAIDSTQELDESLANKEDESNKADSTQISPKAIRKSNDAIGLRVSEGRLSLLSRKMFNALVFHAQELGVPGKFAPIASDVASQYYWVPFSDIASDSDYDSNDNELIKMHLQELQNIKLVMEDDKEWTSERLISSVKIVNSAGFKKRGGKLWIGFAFPPEVASLVLNPAKYTKLSLYYITVLKSGASVALYELCRRYATNPSNLTTKMPWERWYSVLSGNPVAESAPEYKYFKRDLMKPAIDEINSSTDINIELTEYKIGRKVVELQFIVHMNKQDVLDLAQPLVIDTEVINKIISFGFGQKEAGDIYASHSVEMLKGTIQLVESRIANKNADPIGSVSAYFKAVLRGGYANQTTNTVSKILSSSSDVKKIRKQEGGEGTPEFKEMLKRYKTVARERAEQYFIELANFDRDKLMQEFINSAPAQVVSVMNKSGLSSKMVETAFFEWVAIKLWGIPTNEQLLEFTKGELNMG